MPAIVLYAATTVALLFLWHRYVQPLTRAAAIVLVLLPCCFVGRALLTGRVYAPIDIPYASEPLKDYARDYGIEKVHNGTLSDLYMQMIPWQRAVRASLAHGEWPLWNPYLLCGSILAANMQSGVYDPLHWIAMLLSEPQALTYGAAMTFFLAALFTFSFARALGLGELASLFAAAAYMFSQIVAFFVGWPLGRAWAIFPLVLLGVRLVVRETSLRAGVVLTTAFVLLIVAGHPESVLHAVFVGALYGLAEVIVTRNKRAIGLAVLCGVLSLLLTAVVLLPFAEAAPHTAEFAGRNLYMAQEPLDVKKGAVARRAGLSLFPWYGGIPERDNHTSDWEPTNMRAGSIVLALALASLVIAPRRLTWFFALLALFSAWVGLDAWPFAQLLHALPLFDITINNRLAFPAVFAAAMLAAIAVDAWPSARRKRLATAAVLLGTAVILGIATSMVAAAQLKTGVRGEILAQFTIVELLPLAILAVLIAARVPRRIALPVALGLLLVQRGFEDGGIYPAVPQRAFYPVIPVLEKMQRDPELFRMAGLHFAFLPDAAAMYGLHDARGYEAMTFRRLYETYPQWCLATPSFNNVFDTRRAFLSMINVKYVIGSLDPQPNEQWRLALEDRQSRLLQNTRVLPRAFVPAWIRYDRVQDRTLRDMFENEDFAERSFIEAPEYEPHDIANGPGKLAIKRIGTTYEIDADMQGDGWIVVTESSWPGWRAYVDGKRVSTKFANHAFIGVFVYKGKHHVRLTYQPESFTRGRNVSLVTLAGVVGFFVWRRRRKA